jgi:hypothetical protein
VTAPLPQNPLPRFNPPPNWPPPPAGWQPSPGWQPDPSWPAPPDGWQLWIYPPAYSAATKQQQAQPPWYTPLRQRWMRLSLRAKVAVGAVSAMLIASALIIAGASWHSPDWHSGYNFAYTAAASQSFNQQMLSAPSNITWAKGAQIFCRQISETPDYAPAYHDNPDWITGCATGLQRADNINNNTWNNH